MFKYRPVDQLASAVTSHGSGSKKVLYHGGGEPVKLKQIAYGTLVPGETIPDHLHPDMDEVYYFQSGEGIMTVAQTTYQLLPEVFVYVPAGMVHGISANSAALEFFYFGLENDTSSD